MAIAQTFPHLVLKNTGFSFLVDDLSTRTKTACVVPAMCITPQLVNFITKFTSGLFTVAITPSRAEKLQLTATPRRITHGINKDKDSGLSLASVESRNDVTTGISAFDRAKTIHVLGNPESLNRDLITPGHIFPVLTKEGGILQKLGLAEGALAVSSKLLQSTKKIDCDAALFVEAIDSDGNYYSTDALQTIASQFEIPLFTLSELLKETIASTPLIEQIAEAKLPSSFSPNYKAHIFRARYQEGEHMAVVLGEIDSSKPILVRVQNESTITDVFGGDNSSRDLLRKSLETIAERGSGILLYLRKPDATSMIDQTQQLGRGSEMREYGIGAQILSSLGVKKIELLTQSTKALVGLQSFGLEIITQTRIA